MNHPNENSDPLTWLLTHLPKVKIIPRKGELEELKEFYRSDPEGREIYAKQMDEFKKEHCLIELLTRCHGQVGYGKAFDLDKDEVLHYLLENEIHYDTPEIEGSEDKSDIFSMNVDDDTAFYPMGIGEEQFPPLYCLIKFVENSKNDFKYRILFSSMSKEETENKFIDFAFEELNEQYQIDFQKKFKFAYQSRKQRY